MKRFASRLIAIFLSVLLAGSALASCNKPGEKTPVTENETIEPSGSLGETTEKPNPEPIIEGPYRIDYLKGCPNVGNCTAQLVLNPSWTEDFTVEIPAYSPDGNLITHFSRWNNCFVGDCIPKIISEKTYQEAILKPLEEAAARGEMGSLGDGNFYVGRIDSYFQQKNPSEMETDAKKENCIKRYPITDPNGANIPIRVLSEDLSRVEILMVQNYLSKYTSFSKETIKADFAYFQDAIRKSSLNGTQKANLLLEYQYSENDHLVGLTLPDTLWWVQASDLIDFKNLIQTENGISYIGNWVVHADNSLTSIVLRDGTVGIANSIANRAISNENLKSITIPASLKTICGSIVDENLSGCSFRELHISNLAAWCAVRCIDYNDSRLPPFNTAYDLYLNGELLTDLVIPDGVTNIGFGVFSGCNSLTSITLPFVGANADGTGEIDFRNIFGGSHYVPASLKTVVITGGTSIENSAFERCTGLASITIPDSVTSIGGSAFRGCSSLTSITIPGGVTSIGDSAFSGCSSLTSITIPEGVTSIGSGAFSGCNDLIQKDGGVWYVDKWVIDCDTTVTNITLHSDTVGIGNSAFSDCIRLMSITIPDGVTSIGSGAFYACSSLTSITIPNGVTSIGSYAFSDCSSLNQIFVAEGNAVYHSAGNCLIETGKKILITGCKSSVIPTDGSVTSIGFGAFYDCRSLTSITIPDSVTSIGDSVFRNCSSLTSITIGNGVTNIGDSAFFGCSSLNQIFVAEGNTVYHSAGNCLIETGKKNLITGCKSSVIPTDGSVTSIGSYAFSDCSSLTGITIPDSVTSIGSYAFSGCSGLTSITIGNGVTSIGDYAFADCSILTSITIGNGVTSIGDYAFAGCSILTSITFNGTKAQWNAITKGSDWNKYTGSYTVHCTDGDIQK